MDYQGNIIDSLRSWKPFTITLVQSDENKPDPNETTMLCIELMKNYERYFDSRDLYVVMSPSLLYRKLGSLYLYHRYTPEVIDNILQRQLNLRKMNIFSTPVGHTLLVIDDPHISLVSSPLMKELLSNGPGLGITIIINTQPTDITPEFDYKFQFPFAKRYSSCYTGLI